jgi:hypothetical protein
VRDRPDDRPLDAEAQKIMRYATVADLKADAVELAELFAELDEPTKRRLLAVLFRS